MKTGNLHVWQAELKNPITKRFIRDGQFLRVITLVAWIGSWQVARPLFPWFCCRCIKRLNCWKLNFFWDISLLLRSLVKEPGLYSFNLSEISPVHCVLHQACFYWFMYIVAFRAPSGDLTSFRIAWTLKHYYVLYSQVQ